MLVDLRMTSKFVALSVCLALVVVRPALAAREQAVVLATPTGDISGSLLLPDAAPVDKSTKPPVVLIIAGSGPTDRDGNSLGTRLRTDNLKQLAAALADAGFASLRYDKRGIGASAAAGPREIDLRFENYVDDAAAWVDKLAGDERFAGVAIVGHSEGSLIGMLAARPGKVRAFVSVAGPARNAASILRTQLEGRLPLELVARDESILDALEKGRRVDDVPAALATLYRPSVQPYLISWFRYVPSEQFARLTIPSLVIQGDSDIQVPLSEAEALHAARPSAELLIVPGMTHVLKLARPGLSGQTATYVDPTLPLAPLFIRGLLDFLGRTATRLDPQPLPPNRTTP